MKHAQWKFVGSSSTMARFRADWILMGWKDGLARMTTRSSVLERLSERWHSIIHFEITWRQLGHLIRRTDRGGYHQHSSGKKNMWVDNQTKEGGVYWEEKGIKKRSLQYPSEKKVMLGLDSSPCHANLNDHSVITRVVTRVVLYQRCLVWIGLTGGFGGSLWQKLPTGPSRWELMIGRPFWLPSGFLSLATLQFQWSDHSRNLWIK